jgi:hypothetical protein
MNFPLTIYRFHGMVVSLLFSSLLLLLPPFASLAQAQTVPKPPPGFSQTAPILPGTEHLPLCPKVGTLPDEPGVPVCRVPSTGLPAIDWDSLPFCVRSGVPRPQPLPGRDGPAGTPGTLIAMCRSEGVLLPIPPDQLPPQTINCEHVKFLRPEDQEIVWSRGLCPRP